MENVVLWFNVEIVGSCYWIEIANIDDSIYVLDVRQQYQYIYFIPYHSDPYYSCGRNAQHAER